MPGAEVPETLAVRRVHGEGAKGGREGGSERRESNPRSQLGKLMYCLCTTLA
jgi:hypothetical protein